jgi:hypothetical protein
MLKKSWVGPRVLHGSCHSVKRWIVPFPPHPLYTPFRSHPYCWACRLLRVRGKAFGETLTASGLFPSLCPLWVALETTNYLCWKLARQSNTHIEKALVQCPDQHKVTSQVFMLKFCMSIKYSCWEITGSNPGLFSRWLCCCLFNEQLVGFAYVSIDQNSTCSTPDSKITVTLYSTVNTHTHTHTHTHTRQLQHLNTH